MPVHAMVDAGAGRLCGCFPVSLGTWRQYMQNWRQCLLLVSYTLALPLYPHFWRVLHQSNTRGFASGLCWCLAPDSLIFPCFLKIPEPPTVNLGFNLDMWLIAMQRELSVDDGTEPDSKHHKGSGASVEVAPRTPGSLSASTNAPSSTGGVVDVASGVQPVHSLAATASGSVLREEVLSPHGTLSSSEPVTQAAEPPQEVSQKSDAPTSTSSQDAAKPTTSNLSDPCKVSSSDEMLDSLLCVICQEILYKCVRSVVSTCS